jgi:gamma-glutamylcyclotransferase (GGCT)/AIG2-like uncharacterized protein YtfP
MNVHYFAFGSNMCSRRFRGRLPRAISLGRARLDGWMFTCNKTSKDGSAKANIVQAEGQVVWGVVFSIFHSDLPRLDRIEGGYRRVEVEVVTADGSLSCQSYASHRVDDELLPRPWYKQHIIDGAEEHGLPQVHIAMLRALETCEAL